MYPSRDPRSLPRVNAYELNGRPMFEAFMGSVRGAERVLELLTAWLAERGVEAQVWLLNGEERTWYYHGGYVACRLVWGRSKR